MTNCDFASRGAAPPGAQTGFVTLPIRFVFRDQAHDGFEDGCSADEIEKLDGPSNSGRLLTS